MWRRWEKSSKSPADHQYQELTVEIFRGNNQRVKELIESGTNIDYHPENNPPPLLVAAQYATAPIMFLRQNRAERHEIIMTLLSAGAAYDFFDKFDFLTPTAKMSLRCYILEFQRVPHSNESVLVTDTSVQEVDPGEDAPARTEKNCVVCLRPRREKAMFRDCGHITACWNCAQKMLRGAKKECPSCKQAIKDVLKAFDN